MWAAYKSGSFVLPPDLTQEEFVPAVIQLLSRFPILWVIEDDHKGFSSGRGLVGIIGVKTDGWTYLPEVLFFRWATAKNKLRAAVAFFHMMRNTKSVGCCEVRTTRRDFAYMKHMQKYGVLYLRGKIPNGCPQGDVFVFSINGNRREHGAKAGD